MVKGGSEVIHVAYVGVMIAPLQDGDASGCKAVERGT